MSINPDQNDFLFDDDEIDSYIRANFDRESKSRPETDGLPNLDSYYFLKKTDLEYYIWWRTCVRNNEYPGANESMIEFFFRELEVMGKPVEHIERWAAFLAKVYNGTPAGFIAYFLQFNICVSQMRFPGRIDAKASDGGYLGVAFLLAGPSVDLNPRFIKDVLDSADDLPVGFPEFLSRTMENLSETLWRRYDIGIVEFLSNRREEVAMDPIDGIVGRKSRFMYVVDRPAWNDLAERKMNAVINYCLREYSPKTAKRSNIKVDAMVKEAAKKARTDMSAGRPRPKNWLPQRTMLVTPFDNRSLRGEYQRKAEPSPFERKAKMYRVPAKDYYTSSSKDWRDTVAKYIDNSDPRPSGYLPSPNARPLFSELSGEQLNYFLYWRKMFAKGTSIDTDEGYLALHILEILGANGNIGERMDSLMRMSKEYPCKLTKDACMSFALSNELPLPPYSDTVENYFSHWGFLCTVDALKREQIGTIEHMTLNHLLGFEIKDTYLNVDPHEFASVANYLLNRFDAHEKETEGKRLCEFETKKTKKVAVSIYMEMKRYGLAKDRRVVTVNPLANEHVSETVYVAVMSAVRYVCRKNSVPGPQINKMAERRIVSLAERFLDELDSVTT